MKKKNSMSCQPPRASPLTIDGIEKGCKCRIETKRKIMLFLGRDLSDKDKIFPED